MKPRIEVATGRRTPSGVMVTAIPAAVHAATSTESYPTPKRATTAPPRDGRRVGSSWQ
eukprot:CAMPEP_0206327766 /NCGR_PEP_ID=MMETSP0106_2-20121207/22327_1 /ASSEMBLY_ACC=CAM_ASM_000206 /TAXON_ID=81532 /ORGANISM="Acanthoeca-like sp., Strain 10tr" /LENGTH=57 /DNA_ID=CAMNT_0053760413 /DNA_START=394 /DNA_END=567 /DNA_ORIENTATION=-